LDELLRAARRDPDATAARKGSQRKSDLHRAIADYTEAIRRGPTYSDAYFNRGIARRAKGDLVQAGADAVEAHRLDPTRY
jgi:tetratricopeptide (TPR) repeat protein